MKIYDMVTGRFFDGSVAIVARAVDRLNNMLYDRRYVTLNEFYKLLGIDKDVVGDYIGWSVEVGFLEPMFSSRKGDDGKFYPIFGYRVYDITIYHEH